MASKSFYFVELVQEARHSKTESWNIWKFWDNVGFVSDSSLWDG